MKNYCKEFYLKWFYSIKPCNYSFSCGIKICHWTSGKSHYWWHDKSIKAYRHLYPIVSNATFTFFLSLLIKLSIHSFWISFWCALDHLRNFIHLTAYYCVLTLLALCWRWILLETTVQQLFVMPIKMLRQLVTLLHFFPCLTLPFLLHFFRDYCYEYWLTLVKWIKNGELEVDDLELKGVWGTDFIEIVNILNFWIFLQKIR